jgi:peptidoglycan/xylan/chitin deacetylase (PgdA/CDA1 family)/glycosyltransferase involved in cell wall biosynthesis
MALRILHVLSSDFFAGSVAYAIKVAEKQVENGHQVFMVTDMKDLSDKFTCLQLPVSKRSIPQRIKNIQFLKRIIKQYDISIIHAHSRAASWISYYALKGSKIPLVSTIHGCQVKQRSAKKMDVYGDQVIAICPNLIEHLITEIQLKKKKLTHIPNGIDNSQLAGIKRNRPIGKDKVISIVGRFNGPKGDNFAKLVADVFPKLLEEYPALTVQLSGSAWESFPEYGKQAYETLRAKYPDRIKNLGFNRDVFQMMANSDLVIGAGRVALEGLLLKVPVLAIGEACYHGVLTKENIDKAIASNFGDILQIKSDFVPDTDLISNEIRKFLNNNETSIDLTSWLRDYEIDNVVQRIGAIYQSAIMQKVYPKWIPVLMYHKVPDKPINTEHRIFVTRNNFRKHLRFFKFRGLTSITFKDYLAFSNGSRSIREFPRKPFIITFDDGYKDNYLNMLPLTRKYGFKGVLFLLGDFSVTENFWNTGEDKEAGQLMTYEQKKAFVEHGWEIGAHTLTHSDLTKLEGEKIKNEIVLSKTLLEEKLGTEVVSFAYPYGYYNSEIKKIVKEAGLTFGIATDTGGMAIEEDRFAIFRVNMFPEEGLLQLYKKTSPWYREYYRKKRGK